ALDEATLTSMATKVLNPSMDLNALPPEVAEALMIASQPLTDEQREIVNECLASDDCDTGQGGYTLAIVDDQVNTFYSQSRAEVVAAAVKSGAVKRILHFATDMEVQKYLADWRSAIGQGSDLATSIFGGLGNQAGQVVQEAIKAGIPVATGCCPLAPDVAKLITVNTNASICDMWLEGGGGEMIASHLADKGDSDPSYAIFTGPAGNPFAAVWQPCVKEAMEAAGVELVYDGTTEWTPQGTVKAANALIASGEKPDVIVYDTYAEDFIHAYEDSGEDIPTFALTASSTVGTAKAIQEARDNGNDVDAFVASSIVWLQTVAFQAELTIRDEGGSAEPSGDTIDYPMALANIDDVFDTIDLTVNEGVFIGTTLEPEEQNESLKH
ncbi:MAG: sugar ABC transporter substrate-binding protein, partial [Aeromicrobium sp.]